MKKDEVPQQDAKAFMGHSKALYALDKDGRYALQPSSGWEAEEIVLDQAIHEYDEAATEAHARASAGETSPMEYHMCKCRMDLLLLAQSSGYFQWQVRRDLKPKNFKSLSRLKLQRYSEALGLSAEQLQTLPAAP